jgi:hypothetical protein
MIASINARAKHNNPTPGKATGIKTSGNEKP